MRLTTIFLLCIPLSGLSVQTKAQDAIFVYGKGTCTAIDIQNVDEIKMTEEVVDISLGVNYRSTDVDSITFREPEVDYGRIGWWGSSADGPSACYYQSFRKDHPDMTFETADSICTSAFYYLPDEESLLQSRRRVGRKWRYVKNTLSGRRKFQIHQIHQQEADNDHTKMDENGLIYLDLTNQFCNRPIIEARKAVNIACPKNLCSERLKESTMSVVNSSTMTCLCMELTIVSTATSFFGTITEWSGETR